ncbi:response regulator transcription factor [Candidatus Kaiserbacteria bacterium]|nr:response regulator transcription factor [Candidatus Kaiserbacteria bacterium]
MKLLMIEDEAQIANLVKAGLEREGYTVDWVADGLAGQKRIELYHNDYDLVILDLMLPGINGIDICKHVRAKGITVPILILTAKSYVDDKISALDGGADDYLTKPFDFKELLSRLRTLLRRPKDRLNLELRCDGIVLNPSSRKVHIDGKEMRLTLKEFGILEYLMRHPNTVVTRDDILFNVWDFHFDSFSNVVDVHINHLRRKIAKKGRKNFLETVRGVGYRINAVTEEHLLLPA